MPTSPKSCCLASVTKTFPGPKSLVDARDRLRAQRQRRDRLRARGAEDALHARQLRGDQLQRVHAAILARGRDADPFRDARDERGQRRVQHRGGQHRDAAGHVDARPRDRLHGHAHAVLEEGARPVRELALVVALHPIGGEAQRVEQLFRRLRERGVDLLARHLERRVRGAVEALREGAHGRVAVGAHARDDPRDHLRGAQVGAEGLADRGAHGRRQRRIAERLAPQHAGAGRRGALDDAQRGRGGAHQRGRYSRRRSAASSVASSR